jgi:hypothetical protein
MKRTKPDFRMPSHDYGLALQTAMSWLGDRYLLAQPVNRRVETPNPFFAVVKSWHEPRAVVSVTRRKH